VQKCVGRAASIAPSIQPCVGEIPKEKETRVLKASTALLANPSVMTFGSLIMAIVDIPVAVSSAAVVAVLGIGAAFAFRKLS